LDQNAGKDQDDKVKNEKDKNKNGNKNGDKNGNGNGNEGPKDTSDQEIDPDNQFQTQD